MIRNDERTVARTGQYSGILAQLKGEARLRAIPLGAENGTPGLTDLLSNDYLGLAARADEFAQEFLDRFGLPRPSASASRLLARSQADHLQLERVISGAFHRPALLFNSGYHANVGAISALSTRRTLVVADRLAHASMIDGILLGKGRFMRFPHNDVDALAAILKREGDAYDNVVVVTEGVFSMDGDLAPLRDLVDLRRSNPRMILYLDEAHSLGTRGPSGLGLAEELGLMDEVDIIVGTFGKALASCGAFIAASQTLISYLVNCARSFIFSTALPPLNAAWTLLMWEKMRGMDEERRRLADLSHICRTRLESVTGSAIPSRSQIIPIVAGSSERAIAMASTLRRNGFDSLPIRRPTVPPGGERVRISLNAALLSADIERLTDAVALACSDAQAERGSDADNNAAFDGAAN